MIALYRKAGFDINRRRWSFSFLTTETHFYELSPFSKVHTIEHSKFMTNSMQRFMGRLIYLTLFSPRSSEAIRFAIADKMVITRVVSYDFLFLLLLFPL